MIIGIGTDLLDIERVRSILEQGAGERFLERILTPAERELASTRRGRLAEFVSGRFAAKEAVSKAFGCGIGKELSLQDMEIVPDPRGKPVCHISAAALARLFPDESSPQESIAVHLSITHTATTAMAYAVVERRREIG